MVVGNGDEVEIHQVDDGPQSSKSGPDGGADESGFRYRRVADAIRPEILYEAFGRCEWPSPSVERFKRVTIEPSRNVFAHDEDVCVTIQFIAQGSVEGVAVALDGSGNVVTRAGYKNARIGENGSRFCGFGCGHFFGSPF